MAADDHKRSMHRALVDSVLGGSGEASPDQRTCAFDNTGLPEQVQSLVDKVATRSWQITDSDLGAARAASFSDDQIFELIICAAVGESTRQYQAGLAALGAAVAGRES